VEETETKPPVDLAPDTIDPADAAAEYFEAADRDHVWRMCRLAHAFVTRNLPGLGQIEKGDEEKWEQINLLGKYRPVERAHAKASIEALELLAHGFREARSQ
jgi:hypothetical protein